VMEFVAGQALHDWIRSRRPLDERSVLAIALPVLDGLEVVHASGFLHRDIKPGNIFIRGDGSPVLIDFGSARTAAANTELTTIVSPGFAPVEQYDSRGGQGPWSDLYALGGVLYWMVTGQPPIEAPARAFSDPMVPAVKSADGSRFSQPLLRAIDWALTPSKDARPKSVAELRGALRGAPLSTLATALGAPSAGAAFPPTERIVPPAAPVDHETLARLVAELAAHIGPIADKLVKSQLRKGASFAQILDKVAAEIADPKQRAAFVKKFGVQKAGDSSRPAPASAPASAASPAPQRFNPAQLAKAEGELAQYIGAVARVVVKRAAAKARDLPELYLLLADEIEDPQEKKRFVRKAISVSRPQ